MRPDGSQVVTEVFPDTRTGHLVRAILDPYGAAGHWAAYAESLHPEGSGHPPPNEGEARLFPLVAARLAAERGGALEGVAQSGRLKTSLRWARIRQSLALRTRTQIAERLAGAGIPALWTKGTALAASVYRPDEPRVSMDVDVILQWPDVERVAALAEAAGWVPKLAMPSFDARGLIAGTELSFAIPDLVEVDFSWQPRMPFAFDPALRDWLWARYDPAVPVQPADPTWLLLETLEHGLVGNGVSPIRWVVDAVLLIRRAGAGIDWTALEGFAARYRLVLPVLEGLRTVCAFGGAVPEGTLARLAAHPVDPFEEAEFTARIGETDISRNYRIASSYNLLLRAGDGDLALLSPSLAPVNVIGVELRARLERRIDLAAAPAQGARAPADAPLVEPGLEMARLTGRARRFARSGRVALALLHWQAAALADPQDRVAACGLALAQAAVEQDEAACRTLTAVIARFPDDPELPLALGRRQLACRQYAAALATCDALLARQPDNVTGLALRATCLQAVCREDEALADLREAFRLAPDAPAIRTNLAQLLSHMGQHVEVIALSRGHPIDDGKLLPLHLLAAKAAARLGRRDAADARFGRLRRTFPGKVAIPLAAAEARKAALDPEGALAIVRDTVAAFPAELSAHRMLVELLVQLDQPDAVAQHVDAVPKALRLSKAFQLGVLLPALYRLGQIDACRKILVAQSRDGLSPEAGCELVKALWTHGDLEESYARLSDLARRFPDNREVQRLSIIVFGSRDPETLRRTKAAVRARLAPAGWLKLIAPLTSLQLSPEERLEACGWLLRFPRSLNPAKRRILLLGFRTEMAPDLIRLLLNRDRGGGVFFEALKPALHARLTDSTVPTVHGPEARPAGFRAGLRAGLGRSAAGGWVLAGLSAVRAQARQLRRTAPHEPEHSRICLQIARIAGTHPEAHPRLQAALQRHVAAVLRAPRESWMDTGERAAAARALCDWLVARIAKGRPTSVIRLGDGEGHFLPYPEHSRGFQARDRRQVQRDPWWGEELLDAADEATLSAGLIAAIHGADVLGVPNSLRYAAELGWPTMLVGRDCRGIEAISCHLESSGHGGRLASCNLHTDLAHWGLYDRLLGGCRSVSVISCHDIAARLAVRFGVTVRESYRIPGEYRHRRSFHSRADGAVSGRIYPDVFHDIMARLDPRPGEVHLVAAGILGKLMCQRIKERGGIGLDIGSQVDQWADFRTRQYLAQT